MKKIIIYALYGLLIIGLVSGCGKVKTQRQKEEVVPVRVMTVKAQDIKNMLEYVGNVKGEDEALVYPKVTGKIVKKVKEEGSEIEKGEAILYIDRDEIGLTYEEAPVESPLKGIVGRVYADIGANVTTQTPVALVTKTDNVEISLDIPERYIPKISLGQPAHITVDAYPDEGFSGKVTEISPVVDLITRSSSIEITIENKNGRLKSGMFAKVGLVIEEHGKVPAILKEALIGKEPHLYVYVAENGIARLKEITLGIRQGPYYEITSGLKEDDTVVIMGQQRLKDGYKVEVEEYQ